MRRSLKRKGKRRRITLVKARRAPKRMKSYTRRKKIGLMLYLQGREESPNESREVIHERAWNYAKEEEDVAEDGMVLKGWFVPCYLGICKEDEMPSTLLNGKYVNLITLYRVVNDLGGFKKENEENAWEVVALQTGFCCDDAIDTKISYIIF
ncbi:putative transcription factor & chromatin remodeling ARID family [Helianthus anomalus]